MSDQYLPATVATQKLASHEAKLSGTIAVSQLRRLVAVLASDQGEANVVLSFGKDEQGRLRLGGSLRSTVQVFCQRCLRGMPLDVSSDFTAALVEDDDAAQNLPRELDPVLTEDGILDIHRFVEDELLLSLPFTNFHQHQCVATSRDVAETQSDSHKPFANLAEMINNS